MLLPRLGEAETQALWPRSRTTPSRNLTYRASSRRPAREDAHCQNRLETGLVAEDHLRRIAAHDAHQEEHLRQHRKEGD
jgi:hypothetical protein